MGKMKENELKIFQDQIDTADKVIPVEREKVEKINDTEFKFVGNDKKVKVDINEKKIIINNNQDLQIELSKELNYEQVGDTILGYDLEGNILNSIENVGGGFRMVINISKSNKKIYSYDFPLIAKNGEKYLEKENGEFWLVNEKRERLYIVLKPWAKDSAGSSLKTWYTLEKKGAVLRQHIDLKDANFPVIADPTWCGNTVSSTVWKSYLNGDDRETLSIIPTWCGRYIGSLTIPIALQSVYFSAWPANIVWDEVRTRFYSEYAKAICYGNMCWSNASRSMYNQLYCHMAGGFWKAEWNLEPWRGLVSWSTYLATRCNP